MQDNYFLEKYNQFFPCNETPKCGLGLPLFNDSHYDSLDEANMSSDLSLKLRGKYQAVSEFKSPQTYHFQNKKSYQLMGILYVFTYISDNSNRSEGRTHQARLLSFYQQLSYFYSISRQTTFLSNHLISFEVYEGILELKLLCQTGLFINNHTLFFICV